MELPTDDTINNDDTEYIDATADAYNFDEYDDVSGDGYNGAVDGVLDGVDLPDHDHEIPISENDSPFDNYQAHARRSGFSAVKRINCKMYDDKEIKYAQFVYSKAGKGNSRLLSKKTDCEARLNAKKANGWFLGCCQAIYEDFHDVVSFDTTYLVNRFNGLIAI
ncbi:hypothetical protein C2S52_004148 [Perilla frutescens var. hirtella]|nr:hypothetical protein C2S52_004148 [Perilla frutescens var. hirtella]